MSKKGLLDKMVKHKMVLDPKSYRMAHPIYAKKELENVRYTHKAPEGIRDSILNKLLALVRVTFDKFTGYDDNQPEKLDER